MLSLVLALAAAPTVIDAERAFAQMAQDKGQWTAFRATAANGAVMFTPKTVRAHSFLATQTDPPKAIRWQPTHAWVSCDGSLAIDTGNWQSASGKAVGFLTTVWRRQDDGSWKWIYDGGDRLAAARPAIEPVIKQAACRPAPPNMIRLREVGETSGASISADATLEWQFTFDDAGTRTFRAMMWDGTKMVPVLQDVVAATGQ